jgi:outer membrane protein
LISENIKKYKSYGVILIVTLLLTSCSLNAYDLNIDNAIAMALKSNESYLSALQDKLIAEGDIKDARSGAFPKLTFDGNYTRNFELQEITFAGEKFTFGTKNNYNLTFNLEQTLWSSRVFNAMKIAKYYDKATNEYVKAARQQVIFGTREAFYSAILAMDNVNVFRDAVHTAEENFEVVKSLYREGLVSEYDKLSAEVEMANLLPQLIKAENTAKIVLNNLRYFIGYEGFEEIQLKYDFGLEDTIATPLEETALQTALEYRPDYVGQDYIIKAYKKAIGVSKAGRMPSLYFSSALDWAASIDRTKPAKDDWVRSWSASLNLSFPIFDGFKTSGNVKKAKADYIKSSQIEDAIRIEVEESIGLIEESKKRLGWGKKTIELAEEGLRVANLRFKNGVGTQLEIIAAQSALTMAKTNYIQAIYDYEMSLAKYEKAVGLDLPGNKE